MTEPIYPKSRKRADYRVIARILELSHGQNHPSDDLLEEISIFYKSKGGTWVKFFEGNPHHSKLLKMVISFIMKQKRQEHDRRK